MLHFSGALTPAATEIFLHCLEISADLARAGTLGDEWAIAYPLSAKCLTRQRVREALLDSHSTELRGDTHPRSSKAA
jgi:hypothetical protein